MNLDSGSSTRRLGFWLAAAMAMATPAALSGLGCASVLGIGDYQSAAERLCRCDTALPLTGQDCRDYVNNALAEADETTRGQWLGAYEAKKCGETCALAGECFRQEPLCAGHGEACLEDPDSDLDDLFCCQGESDAHCVNNKCVQAENSDCIVPLTSGSDPGLGDPPTFAPINYTPPVAERKCEDDYDCCGATEPIEANLRRSVCDYRGQCVADDLGCRSSFDMCDSWGACCGVGALYADNDGLFQAISSSGMCIAVADNQLIAPEMTGLGFCLQECEPGDPIGCDTCCVAFQLVALGQTRSVNLCVKEGAFRVKGGPVDCSSGICGADADCPTGQTCSEIADVEDLDFVSVVSVVSVCSGSTLAN